MFYSVPGGIFLVIGKRQSARIAEGVVSPAPFGICLLVFLGALVARMSRCARGGGGEGATISVGGETGVGRAGSREGVGPDGGDGGEVGGGGGD